MGKWLEKEKQGNIGVFSTGQMKMKMKMRKVRENPPKKVNKENRTQQNSKLVLALGHFKRETKEMGLVSGERDGANK